MLRPLHLLLSLILLGGYTVVQAGTPDFTVKLWKSPIAYTIDSRFDETVHANIRAAIKQIEENTCIDFQEGLDGPLLEFAESTGCESDIGDVRYGKNQKINLTGMCYEIPGILHETYHALGFVHEQQRPDRDTYIRVNFDNMTEEFKRQFEKLPVNKHTTDYGIPYDYGSLIHYTTSEGITPIDGDYAATIDAKGQGMMYNDWKVINLHYKCSDKCPEKKICQNGGYQHPRDCNLCVCTRFYEGGNCEIERNLHILKPGEALRLNFGWHFNVSTYKGMLARHSEFDEMPDRNNLERSPARTIRAPEGSRIKVTINNIFDAEIKEYGCSSTCTDKALEIVDGDLTRVGKRFCCNSTLPYSFVSETNVVGYHVYAISGLNFVANVTFTVEGSEPETTVDETGTEKVPFELEPTTTSAPFRAIEMVVIKPEDYPSDALYRFAGMLCHCSEDGAKCDPNAPANVTVSQVPVQCECNMRHKIIEYSCKLVPKNGSAN